MSVPQDWEATAEKDYQSYVKRVELVELILEKNGLDHKQRQGMRGDIVQRASHSFEAPHSLSPSTHGQLPF